MVLYTIEFEFTDGNGKGRYHSCHSVSADGICDAQQQAFNKFQQNNRPIIHNIVKSVVKVEHVYRGV